MIKKNKLLINDDLFHLVVLGQVPIIMVLKEKILPHERLCFESKYIIDNLINEYSLSSIFSLVYQTPVYYKVLSRFLLWNQ